MTLKRPRVRVCRFQPEHRLWPVDFLRFRDEMTTGNNPEWEICDVDPMHGCIRSRYILDGAAQSFEVLFSALVI